MAQLWIPDKKWEMPQLLQPAVTGAPPARVMLDRSAPLARHIVFYVPGYNHWMDIVSGVKRTQDANSFQASRNSLAAAKNAEWYLYPTTAIPTNEYSVALWMKFYTTTVSDSPGILEPGDGTQPNRHMFYYNGGNDWFQLWDGNSTTMSVDRANVVSSITQWNHYILTISATSGSHKLYGNGIEASSYVAQGGVDSHTMDQVVLLNRYDLATSNPGNGEMTDVRIYDKVLTDEEAMLVYKQPRPLLPV